MDNADLLSDTPFVPAQARSVTLFLVDGRADGIVLAAVGNWNGQVLAAPRGRLSALLRRPEASRTGIYLLFGPDPDRPDGILAYIGEADDIAKRLRIHLRDEDRDFFDRLAFVTSTDESLTKAHVRFLESRLIHAAQTSGSVALTNSTHPDFQKLPEAARADMDAFLAHLQLVLPLVGFDLFRRATSSAARREASEGAVFGFSTAGAAATARETEDGFVVLAGSTARRGQSGSFPAGYAALRQKLLLDGHLGDDAPGGVYRFTTDVVFSSPSAAASIIAARSASGPLEWKLQASGQTYREWRERRLAEAG
jgi:hypothetical protein